MKIVDHRVPTYDFVRAMGLAGYRALGSTSTHVVLEKDDIRLLVPKSDDLPEDVILSLLRKAEITPLVFVVLLNRLESRDTLPEQRMPSAGKSRE